MRRWLLVTGMLGAFAFVQSPVDAQTGKVAAGPENNPAKLTKTDTLSLYQVNFISMDSLQVADSLGRDGRGSATDSPYMGDTITTTGVVIAKPGLIGISKGNISFYIQSTDSAEWGGMNIFGDSATALSVGMATIDTGYVIKLTGVLTKYQPTSIVGNFELMPVADRQVESPSQGPRPAPVEIKLSDLVTKDIGAGGTMHFYPGTKYKNSYVIIRNLTVKSVTTFTSSVGKGYDVVLQDSLGNLISMYDASKYFTARSYADNPNYEPPPASSKIDYVRGILTAYYTTGYRITPLYPGDVKVGVLTPSMRATGFPTRRSAAFPLPTEDVQVSVIAKSSDPKPEVKVDSAAVYYSVNNGAYTRIMMTQEPSDTEFVATIPKQADGSLVKYFFAAWQDTSANRSIVPDTAESTLFYYVKSNTYTIKDIQYTPFGDGVSGVVDLPVTVRGRVESDTTTYPPEIDRTTTSKKAETPMVFMQDGTGQWSGILLYDSLAQKLHAGDSALVVGTVVEYSDWTEIRVDSIHVIQSGLPLYPAVRLNTGTLGGRLSGDPSAEPWESMLVRFDSVFITNIDPDNRLSDPVKYPLGSFREYVVDDGTGGCRVDDDGTNTYSVDPHDADIGFTILKDSTFIGSLTGTAVYTHSAYKIEPRTNSDFENIVMGIRQVSAPRPTSFTLEQNYPNPFNPTTTLRYSIPQASMVTMKIYNVLGQLVTTLVSQRQSAGTYTVTFEASRFASGVYFYRLTAGSFSSVKKMMLLK